MDNTSTKIPTWVVGYAVFLSLVGFVAAGIAYFNPGLMFSRVAADWNALLPVTGMFAARNLAFGVMMALAVYRRNPHSLMLMFIGRFVVELQDLMVLGATGAAGLPVAALITSWFVLFLIPELLAFLTLQRVFFARHQARGGPAVSG